MPTDKNMLLKGVRRLAYTVALMFSGPFVLYQAFKNEGHPFYYPVLIIGAVLAIGAVAMGFYSIKTLIDALFGSKK